MAEELIYTKDKGVIFKGTGVMSGSASVALNAELMASILAGQAIDYQIVDLAEVDTFDFTTQDMKELARQDAKLIAEAPHLLIAIVVNDSFSFGMNRMYATYVEMNTQTENCQVFKSMEQAQTWVREHRQSNARARAQQP